jgi:hypothetical protein
VGLAAAAGLGALVVRRADRAGRDLRGGVGDGGEPELHTSNPALYARLTGRALPLVIAVGACGLAVLTLLTIGRLYGVRIIAAAGVAAVLTVGPSYALLLTLQDRQVLRAGQTQGTGPIVQGARTSPAAGSSGQHCQSPSRQARGSRATTAGLAALTRRRNR